MVDDNDGSAVVDDNDGSAVDDDRSTVDDGRDESTMDDGRDESTVDDGRDESTVDDDGLDGSAMDDDDEWDGSEQTPTAADSLSPSEDIVGSEQCELSSLSRPWSDDETDDDERRLTETIAEMYRYGSAAAAPSPRKYDPLASDVFL